MLSVTVKQNILNGTPTIITTYNHSYIFQHTPAISNISNISNMCVCCKKRKWSLLSLHRDNICSKCFSYNCCKICKILCGEQICEDCEEN